MTESDPCAGCLHLKTMPWPWRPECLRGAQYAGPQCRPERVKRTPAPPPNPSRRPRDWQI